MEPESSNSKDALRVIAYALIAMAMGAFLVGNMNNKKLAQLGLINAPTPTQVQPTTKDTNYFKKLYLRFEELYSRIKPL